MSSETRIFKCQVKKKYDGFSQNVGTSQITMCPECWLWVPCRDSLNPWDFNTKSISFLEDTRRWGKIGIPREEIPLDHQNLWNQWGYSPLSSLLMVPKIYLLSD